MENNKVVLADGTTLIDLTDSTVTPETLLDGVVAYNAKGERIVGTMALPQMQTQGNWQYKVYDDGTFEAWYSATGQTLVITAQSGNLYRSELQTLTLPTNMTAGKTVTIKHAQPNVAHNNYPVFGMLASIQTNAFKYYAMSGGSRSTSPNYIVTAYVQGLIS